MMRLFPKTNRISRVVMAALVIALASFAPSVFAQDEPPQQEGCGGTYTVQPGDTLSVIAVRCLTTVRALLDANPDLANPNLVITGQTLNIPEVSGEIPAGGIWEGMEFPLPAIPVTGPQAGPCGEQYVVQPGDTLGDIAIRCETSVAALMSANADLTNPNLIIPGQALAMPAEAGQIPEGGIWEGMPFPAQPTPGAGEQATPTPGAQQTPSPTAPASPTPGEEGTVSPTPQGTPTPGDLGTPTPAEEEEGTPTAQGTPAPGGGGTATPTP